MIVRLVCVLASSSCIGTEPAAYVPENVESGNTDFRAVRKHRFYPRLAPPYIRPPIRALIRAYPCAHPRRKCTEMRGSAYGIKRAGADPLYPRSLLQSARGCRAVRVPRYPRLLVTSARRGERRGLVVRYQR